MIGITASLEHGCILHIILTGVPHPAVLSTYLIYFYYFFLLYYFFVTLDFYKNSKAEDLSSREFLMHFDAMLWMWLLAFAFVKILSYRDRTHLHVKLLLIQEHQARKAEWKAQKR